MTKSKIISEIKKLPVKDRLDILYEFCGHCGAFGQYSKRCDCWLSDE